VSVPRDSVREAVFAAADRLDRDYGGSSRSFVRTGLKVEATDKTVVQDALDDWLATNGGSWTTFLLVEDGEYGILYRDD
jgi:hypothetical protein